MEKFICNRAVSLSNDGQLELSLFSEHPDFTGARKEGRIISDQKGRPITPTIGRVLVVVKSGLPEDEKLPTPTASKFDLFVPLRDRAFGNFSKYLQEQHGKENIVSFELDANNVITTLRVNKECVIGD